MKPKVYIFRGAPASGKGTLVPRFAEMLPKPIVLIEQDKLRWGFHLIGREIGEVSAEEHRMAHENMFMLFERYLKTGKYNIVVEGLFTWDDKHSSEGSAKELLDIAHKYNYDAKSVVIRANKQELLKRNSQREYSVPSGEFESLYAGVYDEIGPNELVIDSSGQSPNDTLQNLIELIY